jgi:miniconductance mechanosensitive channel
VASIQLTSNEMIRVGDWIEMPQYGADGDIIDVALHTVKVQNWDKTITTIPTHKLISESFRNWRGMSESGGRRIKRALHIDLNSVRFLDDADVERFGRFALLRDYIAAKKEELAQHNRQPGIDPSLAADVRRLTNIGTLRNYIVQYLRQHPRIHQGMTLIVRQREPGPEGLPLEIYTFANDTAWARYEEIQSDIFDHILAVVPEFGLRLFQSPSGSDFARLASHS